jgi:hypothetical protein
MGNNEHKLSQRLLRSEDTYLRLPIVIHLYLCMGNSAFDGCRSVLRHLSSSQFAPTRESMFNMLVVQFMYLDIHCRARTRADPWGCKR